MGLMHSSCHPTAIASDSKISMGLFPSEIPFTALVCPTGSAIVSIAKGKYIGVHLKALRGSNDRLQVLDHGLFEVHS